VTVYQMITNAFTFRVEIEGEVKTFRVEIEGEVKELNRSDLMVYARDPRPEVRAAIYQELYRVFGEEGTVLGQIYQYVRAIGPART